MTDTATFHFTPPPCKGKLRLNVKVLPSRPNCTLTLYGLKYNIYSGYNYMHLTFLYADNFEEGFGIILIHYDLWFNSILILSSLAFIIALLGD